MQGKLIVFEGVEGCGKTTQIQRSRDWLLASMTEIQPDVSIVVTREPGGTELGVGLRQLLLEERGQPMFERAELLLYAADRAQHVEQVLKPTLAKGGIVLCDRFTYSTIAYQGYGRGLSLSLIQQLNQIATGGLESDLTIWLDVDVEIGLSRAKARGKADRMEQADLDFHRRVSQGYRELATANPAQIARVDASSSEPIVQQQIQQILHKHLTQWQEQINN